MLNLHNLTEEVYSSLKEKAERMGEVSDVNRTNSLPGDLDKSLNMMKIMTLLDTLFK